MEPGVFSENRYVRDDLDRSLALALQANGRATWREIAAVLEVSESTVARRARYLIQEGLVQVTAIADANRCGLGRNVLVQFSCPLRELGPVAEKLADREDTRFVALVTGPCDLLAEIIVPSRLGLLRVLMKELANVSGIRSTVTTTVLRQFKGAQEWASQLIDRPIPWRVTTESQEHFNPVPMDPVDEAIYDHLRADGRRSNSEIANSLGLNEAAVRRRIDALIRTGRVRPMTLADSHLTGTPLEAMVWIGVQMAGLPDAALRLRKRPEVRYLAAVAGSSDLVAEVVVRDEDDLFRFDVDVLGSIPQVTSVNTTLVLDALKRSFVRSPPGAGYRCVRTERVNHGVAPNKQSHMKEEDSEETEEHVESRP